MFTNRLNYYLAAFFFNTFPLPQREAGARQTLRYIGEVTGDGLFGADLSGRRPHGQGDIKPFRGGIGMIGSRLELPVFRCDSRASIGCCTRGGRWPNPGGCR